MHSIFALFAFFAVNPRRARRSRPTNMSTERTRVLPLQLAFKDAVTREVARRIAARALHFFIVWPDEVKTDDLDLTDKNCVGSAYHWLGPKGAGIICQDFSLRRTSKASGANGRAIFGWRLKDAHLAKTFLERSVSTEGNEGNQVQKELVLA